MAQFVDVIAISDSIHSLVGAIGAKHHIGDELTAKFPNNTLDVFVGGAAEDIVESIVAHAAQLDGDHVPATEASGDPVSKAAAGKVLHIAWMLNDVCVGNNNDAITGTCEDNVTVSYKVHLDAKQMGTLARRFPRAIFRVGGDASIWGSKKEFDAYVSAAKFGISETGRKVFFRIVSMQKTRGSPQV
jgi:hypothetical protein